MVSLDKITIEKSLRLDFSATNNEVEYKALLVRIAMVQKMGGKGSRSVLRLKVCCRLSKGRIRN